MIRRIPIIPTLLVLVADCVCRVLPLVTELRLGIALSLVGAPFFQAAYVAIFPRISASLGYGAIEDEPAVQPPAADVEVTLYTAAGCPFCPILEERLTALMRTMGFTLKEVDVTLRPDIVKAKKISALPVVEVGREMRAGNLTSQELAELIARAAVRA